MDNPPQQEVNNKNIWRRAGAALAVAMHPLFLYFYTNVFFWALAGGISCLAWQLLVVFGLTALLPIIFVRLVSEDIHLRRRESRYWPLGFAAACYIGAYYALGSLPCQVLYFSLYYLLLVTCGILILLLITFFYKISAHAFGISSLLALGLALFNNNVLMALSTGYGNWVMPVAFLPIFGIPGVLVIWQRVASGAHSVWQVVWGSALGFGLTLAGLLLLM